MHQYWAYGLLVESEIAFPELLPYAFETPDVTIRLGKTPKELIGENVLHRVHVSISQSEYLLKVLNIANYYSSNGNEIIVEPLPEGDEKSMRLFLLSNALTAILYQRNFIPLHASGIINNHGVVLFCGKSGAGKSTIISAMHQKGYKVFTDDVCVLHHLQNGHILGYPSYPTIRLWRDSFEKIGLPILSEEKRIREQLPKYAKYFHEKFEPASQAVKQVFILENKNRIREVKSKKLTSYDAFKEIEKNAFKPAQMFAMNKRNLLFKIVSTLCKNSVTYKIERPVDYNTIEDITTLIEKVLL